MGLFNGYANQIFELTEKQILLEYGDMLIEGEKIEKATKLGFDKWVFTNYRLLLVIPCKGNKYEIQSIPYATIRKFSIIKSESEKEAELNIYLKDEPNALRKTIKNIDIVNQMSKIIARQICLVNPQVGLPLVKLNSESLS